jgi:cell division protein FtsB
VSTAAVSPLRRAPRGLATAGTDQDGFRSEERPLRAAPSIARKKPPRLAYVVVIIVGIAAIVVTQLILSISLSDGAYQINTLQGQQKELLRTNQGLTETVQQLRSPQYLVGQAEGQGMVADGNTVYLRLSDGAILGSPTALTPSDSALGTGATLVPNSLLGASAGNAAGATAAEPGTAGENVAATSTDSTEPSAPTNAPVDPNVPWQGDLPSPTTR